MPLLSAPTIPVPIPGQMTYGAPALPFVQPGFLNAGAWQVTQAARFADRLGISPVKTLRLVGASAIGHHVFCAIDDVDEDTAAWRAARMSDTDPAVQRLQPPLASTILPNGLEANAERLDLFAFLMHGRIQRGEIDVETILSEEEPALECLEAFVRADLGLEGADDVVVDVLLNEYLDVVGPYEAWMVMYHDLISTRAELEEALVELSRAKATAAPRIAAPAARLLVSDPLGVKVTTELAGDAKIFPGIVARLTEGHADVPMVVIRGVLAQMMGRRSAKTDKAIIREGRKLIDGYTQRLADIDRIITEKVPEAYRNHTCRVIVGRVNGYYHNLEQAYTGVGAPDPDAFVFQQFKREVLGNYILDVWVAYVGNTNHVDRHPPMK